jgi:hypothetical protein
LIGYIYNLKVVIIVWRELLNRKTFFIFLILIILLFNFSVSGFIIKNINILKNNLDYDEFGISMFIGFIDHSSNYTVIDGLDCFVFNSINVLEVYISNKPEDRFGIRTYKNEEFGVLRGNLQNVIGADFRGFTGDNFIFLIYWIKIDIY